MRNYLKWLCLFVCIIGFFMSGMIVDTIIRYSVASAFFIGFIIVYVVDGMRSKRIFNETMKNEKQINEIIRNICDSDYTFNVTCPSGIWPGMFILVLGLLCIGCLDALKKLAGSVVILFGLHAIIIAISKIGRPRLALNKAGFDTPEYGFIPWNKVEHIKLTSKTIEHVSIFFFNFHIPDLDSYRKQFGKYQAFLFQFRSKTSKQIAAVTLLDANELPETIHNIAEELMKRANTKDCV